PFPPPGGLRLLKADSFFGPQARAPTHRAFRPVVGRALGRARRRQRRRRITNRARPWARPSSGGPETMPEPPPFLAPCAIFRCMWSWGGLKFGRFELGLRGCSG